MRQIRQRLTYANLASTLALFLVLGGGAYAASKVSVPRNSVGTKQLKSNSVSAEKLKREAISTPKLRTGAVSEEKIANGAITSSKIADGAVSTAKLPDASVTSSKLDPSQRSEALAFSASSSFDLFDSYEPASWTTVMSLALPEGNWVLDSSLALSISTNVPTHVACRLSEGGTVLAQGGTEGERVSATTPSFDGISLSGLATQGSVALTCGDTLNGVVAGQRSLVARRVGGVAAG
jgi:hypothetical protein